jgi:hypothetical protein
MHEDAGQIGFGARVVAFVVRQNLAYALRNFHDFNSSLASAFSQSVIGRNNRESKDLQCSGGISVLANRSTPEGEN